VRHFEHVGHDLVDAFGFDERLQERRVGGLGAGLFAGGFFGGGGRLRREGPRSGRGLEFVEQVADLSFEREDFGFRPDKACREFAATGALGSVHAARIADSSEISCARLRKVKGYPIPKAAAFAACIASAHLKTELFLTIHLSK
jgi:hypothetical protein